MLLGWEKCIMTSTHLCSVMHGDVTVLTVLWSPASLPLTLTNVSQVYPWLPCSGGWWKGAAHAGLRKIVRPQQWRLNWNFFSQSDHCRTNWSFGGEGVGCRQYIMSFLLSFVRQCLLKSGSNMTPLQESALYFWKYFTSLWSSWFLCRNDLTINLFT